MSVTAVAVIEQRGNVALQDARALIITTQDGYVMACEARKALKAIEKEINETFDPVIEANHRAHKEALAAKAKHFVPVQEAGKIIGGKMSSWEQEQERLRRIEEDRLRELARIAEETRRLAEAAAREEESRRLRAEQERLMKIAEEAAAKGRAQEAEAALAAAAQAETESIAEQEQATQDMEEAISAPPPMVFVPKATPKVAGISYSEKWDFEVVDESKIPREYLVRDDVKIRRIVTAMKENTNIPGIRTYSKKIQNTRI